MLPSLLIRGPLLNPNPSGSVDFFPDGCLAADASSNILFAGHHSAFLALRNHATFTGPTHTTSNLLTPAFFDCHIHVPQHPIRGRFVEGVSGNPPEGRLLAGLNKNVFPTEARAADPTWFHATLTEFLRDTRSNAVIGGSTYITVHPAAAHAALQILPPTWSVGLVLMQDNCPAYLRTNLATLDSDITSLASPAGPRLILTDRFAVTVPTPLRTRAVALAKKFHLRMQTHLNEQLSEKSLVEKNLYPHRGSYTDIYAQDGLLSCDAILAHCIQGSTAELALLRDTHASIAHCPTSNTLLGSGVMPLDTVHDLAIPYAICTDVGASPTTSLLHEMAQFLRVHAHSSSHATPSQALFRTTLAAAQIMHLDHRYGSFAPGKSLSYAEILPNGPLLQTATADDIIRTHLLHLPSTIPASPARTRLLAGNVTDLPTLAALEAEVHESQRTLESKIARVVLDGTTIFQR